MRRRRGLTGGGDEKQFRFGTVCARNGIPMTYIMSGAKKYIREIKLFFKKNRRWPFIGTVVVACISGESRGGKYINQGTEQTKSGGEIVMSPILIVELLEEMPIADHTLLPRIMSAVRLDCFYYGGEGIRSVGVGMTVELGFGIDFFPDFFFNRRGGRGA